MTSIFLLFFICFCSDFTWFLDFERLSSYLLEEPVWFKSYRERGLVVRDLRTETVVSDLRSETKTFQFEYGH